MVCLSRSTGKAQAFPIEHSVNALPTDLAVTPDGTRAVVRSLEHPPGGGYTDSFQVIRLSDGFMLTASACPVTSPAGHRPTLPSDTIQATNSRAIAIASATTTSLDDTTIIDVVDINATPACLAHHVLTGSVQQSHGEPSDLAITPDGGYAVVNSHNWIHVIDLPSGGIAAAFNIGAMPAGICDPSFIADSVACTNERAVVVTARYPNGFPGRAETWVYVVDVTAMVAKLEHELSGPNEEISYPPHDLAITRDGTKAVVVASKVVGLYDLYNASPVAQYVDDVGRTYRINVDSVEVTNSRALVIGDLSRTVPPYGTWSNWCVEVFDITSGLTRIAIDFDPGWNDPVNATVHRAHDLAIAPEGERALVRTEFDNVVIKSIDVPVVPFTALRSPALANPLAGTNSQLQFPVFTSDSVVIAPVTADSEVPVQKAVTIGTVAGTSGQSYVTYVDFIDLAATNPTPTELGPYQSAHPSGTGNCIAADLKLTRDQSRVAVRTAEPYADAGSATGTDFLLFTLFPPALQAQGGQWGATGNVMSGVDCLEVGRDRAITISETRLSGPSNPDVPPWWGDGYIQVFDL
jgi:hypothetical protein